MRYHFWNADDTDFQAQIFTNFKKKILKSIKICVAISICVICVSFFYIPRLRYLIGFQFLSYARGVTIVVAR